MQHAPRHTRVHVSRPRRGKVKGVPRLLRQASSVFRDRRRDDKNITTVDPPVASRHSRVSLDQNDSNIFRLVANASRGGGHWHARGRSNRERPVFAPPSARPRAGHREAAERRVNPRHREVEELQPPRRRISGFWRGLATRATRRPIRALGLGVGRPVISLVRSSLSHARVLSD
jgi:hypothetical protein